MKLLAKIIHIISEKMIWIFTMMGIPLILASMYSPWPLVNVLVPHTLQVMEWFYIILMIVYGFLFLLFKAATYSRPNLPTEMKAQYRYAKNMIRYKLWHPISYSVIWWVNLITMLMFVYMGSPEFVVVGLYIFLYRCFADILRGSCVDFVREYHKHRWLKY